MGKRGDLIDGVLLLDKPQGMSSNGAMQKARRLLNAQKVGHTGTLDPMATGLLPLCFGNASKFSADLLHADKAYEARVKLGVTTDTGDAEGTPLVTRAVTVSFADIEEVAKRFLGTIAQVPPMYSALKRNGEKLYEIARRGEVVEREARQVTIHELVVKDFDGESFTMIARVSKGTYIRVLAEDIGEALGCGAHLIALRRTMVGGLTIENAVTLESLEACESLDEARQKLAPVDTLLQSLPVVVLSRTEAERFMHGQRLAMGLTIRGCARVYGPEENLLGIAQVNDRGVLQPERLIAH